jgi:hypothetical protein
LEKNQPALVKNEPKTAALFHAYSTINWHLPMDNLPTAEWNSLFSAIGGLLVRKCQFSALDTLMLPLR